jgi:hypothetical protein
MIKQLCDVGTSVCTILFLPVFPRIISTSLLATPNSFANKTINASFALPPTGGAAASPYILFRL